MLQSVKLEDCVLKNPVTVRATDNVMVAINLIINQRVSGVCVVDDKNNLLGVLSELDCLEAILSPVYNEGGVGTVQEYMTTEDLKVTDLNESIVNVAQQMLEDHLRRRPVLVDGKLVGQITCRQLLKAVRDYSR